MNSVLEISAAVRSGQVTAVDVVDRCLAALEANDNSYVAVTRVLTENARREAQRVDTAIASGKNPGVLAGVPYGVKDLFDVKGLATTAGSSLYANAPRAQRDAEAIRRLGDAGAILVATLNMDEFAYGFATINAHHGTTRNPHDVTRLAGGSSGGSAAVVAAGLLPFSLGSDTNGSVRVPASLTGVYGIKPTHGALPLAGTFPFAESFDDIGPFARSVADLKLLCEVLGEVLDGTPIVDAQPSFNVGRLGGRFRENVDPDQITAIDSIAPDAPIVDLPDIARARSAAFLITAYEGGMVHREALAQNAMAFDPATRDRLIAGALLPHSVYEQAQAFRERFNNMIDDLLKDFDILLAPATPCLAPMIDDPNIFIDGELSPARRELGIHTQPISFMGLPALAVPLYRPGRLPLGLQLIGKRDGEAALFSYAAGLEAQGLIGVSMPTEMINGG